MSATSAQPWQGTEPLPVGTTILMEASAGTGKTYQIEGLVVRLVAQYGIGIDRILVITFTNAATAELRHRIRKRLSEARAAMLAPTPHPHDRVFQELWKDATVRDARRGRLEAALSAFDQAPISTIHGFCQRMLDQLAFESGQEPGLTLTKSMAGVVDEIIADAMAHVFVQAEPRDLGLLQKAKWEPKGLSKLAQAMTRAVQPRVEPVVSGAATDGARDVGNRALQSVRQWWEQVEAFNRWFDSPQGHAAAEVVIEACDDPKPKRIKGSGQRTKDAVEKLRAWRAGPQEAPPSGKLLTLGSLTTNWQGQGDSKETFEAYPLYAWVSGLKASYEVMRSQPRAYFAGRIRELVEAELERTRQLAFSSLISRLATRIAEEGGAQSTLAAAIRGRFDAALIDEFQDTDGAQWPIMRAVFQHPERRLLLVGDPKQAIYGFRGADIRVYMDAASTADLRATMTTNWRSDGPYVAAMNHLFKAGTGALGMSDVDYIKVLACSRHQAPRMRGAPAVAGRPRRPFEIRWVDASTDGGAPGPITNKAHAERLITQLTAQEALRLLAGTELQRKKTEGSGDPGWRPVGPGDIAVLVRTNDQAQRMKETFTAYGVPAVTGGRGSVLGSEAADWMIGWLEAVGHAYSTRHARRLAISPMFGWTANALAEALDAPDSPDGVGEASRWDRWLEAIRGWGRRWSKHGFIGAFDAAMDSEGVLERLLTSTHGERAATDLRHLAELCHVEERRTRTGPVGLATWLRQKRREADAMNDAEALRLESDARAVQIVTVHKSKGLQWPIVLLPLGWADMMEVGRDGAPVAFHRPLPDGGEELCLNVEVDRTDTRRQARRAGARALDQENRRLLYVALTRAKHHCVAWMGPLGKKNKDGHPYALGQIALRDEQGTPSADEPWPTLQALAATSQETLGASLEPPPQSPGALGLEDAPWRRDALKPAPLRARAWQKGGALTSAWQVSSYTSIAKGRAIEDSEPQRPELDLAPSRYAEAGEGVQVELEPPRGDDDLGEPVPSSDLFGGAAVGTWVHDVYEHLDFGSGDGLDATPLAELIGRLAIKHNVTDTQQMALLEDLIGRSLDTRLDGGRSGLPQGFTLRHIGRSDRVDEMAFDLKVGAGNRWRPDGDMDRRLDVAGALKALGGRLGDAPWGGDGWLRSVIAQGASVLPDVAGLLTGFIDLTFRHGDRYFLADYKTNRIAPVGDKRNTRVGHYSHAWMAWEMAHHGYHLQSLLYTVALHRLLGLRLEDYAYDRHIGGHFYLFVRGMLGTDTPRDEGLSRGVYFDRWPKSVVEGLDAALAGRPAERQGGDP